MLDERHSAFFLYNGIKLEVTPSWLDLLPCQETSAILTLDLTRYIAPWSQGGDHKVKGNHSQPNQFRVDDTRRPQLICLAQQALMISGQPRWRTDLFPRIEFQVLPCKRTAEAMVSMV